MKFNKLTFLEFTDPIIRIDGRKRKRALFKCDCGDIKSYDFSQVKTGHTTRCIKCARISAAEKKTTHGLIKHPLYRKWQDMKNRCYNKKVDRYKNYGGRGIRVCKDWKNDFKSFYQWCIKNNWEQGLTIDRIDLNRNYEPDNCRFITMIEQGFNKTNTFYVTFKGKKVGLSEILYRNGMSFRYGTIWSGLKIGKSFDYYVEKYNLKDLDLLNNPPF